MLIYLVRHGETEGNKNKVFQGHTGGELSSEGKIHAMKVANFLVDKGISKIFSSNLSRALETATYTYEKIHVPLIKDPLLAEANIGIWEGKPMTDPEWWRHSSVEQFDSLIIRAKKFLEEFKRTYSQEKAVAWFGHSGINRAILCAILNRIEYPDDLPQNNGCINLIELNGGNYRVINTNYTEHLK
jgi:broad specificity phosphatase PhoE